MHIEHVALWTEDIDRLVDYYSTYFEARPGARYTNRAKRFESCFLSFNSGARLELMSNTSRTPVQIDKGTGHKGYVHVAIALGSKHNVDALSRKLKQDGYPIVDGPRRTGDGYYESVTLDPDGNRIELTV